MILFIFSKHMFAFFTSPLIAKEDNTMIWTICTIVVTLFEAFGLGTIILAVIYMLYEEDSRPEWVSYAIEDFLLGIERD